MSEHIDLKNKYIVGQLLKNATRTYQCKDKKTGQAYAVKEFSIRDLNPAQVTELEDQIKTIQGFNHYTVIQVVDIIKINNSIYVIQEFVENSSICYMAGLMPEFMLRKYINILVQALIYTNNNHYIIANFTLNSVYTSKAGLLKIQFLKFQTKQILSPEEANGQKLTVQANVFQLGLIIQHMISGEESELVGNQELMSRCQVEDNIQQLKCSDVMKSFLLQCLAKHPSDRITIANVVKEHMWIFNTDFQESQSKLLDNNKDKLESEADKANEKTLTIEQMQLNTSTQHLDCSSQGDDSNDDNMNFQTNVPIKKLVIRKQKTVPKPKPQIMKQSNQIDSQSVIKSTTLNSNDISISLNKSPKESPRIQQPYEHIDDDDDVNITTGSKKKVILSPRKKSKISKSKVISSQTLNIQKQTTIQAAHSEQVDPETLCFTIAESNEGVTQDATNSLRRLVELSPEQIQKINEEKQKEKEQEEKKHDQLQQMYLQQMAENEMKLKPQKTVNFQDLNILDDDDSIGFEIESGPQVKLQINKKQLKKRNKSFSQQDYIDFESEIESITKKKLNTEVLQEQAFNQLSLQNQGQYRTEFQQNWQILSDISNDINIQQAEIAIHNLTNLHYKSPDSFMECFYKFYQTNFILNIFNKCKYCDQIQFKLIEFINQMQSNVDFAQKCQVVGYQNALYDYLTSIKQKQIILNNQQLLINYIKVNTSYILRQEADKKDLHNLFIIFINNNGFKLMKTLIQITQYKQPQQSYEELVFQYFTDNNIAIQQQLFGILKKAGQCFNQQQYIYMLLTQTNDCINDNLIIQLLHIVSAMLNNYKSQTISKNVQQLIYFNTILDYISILLNCVKCCISQETYQQQIILQLVNTCLKTLLSIEIKQSDKKYFDIYEQIINNMILIISEICHPRTEEIINITWNTLNQTIGEMFTKLKSINCITYLMIYLNQTFIVSSQERTISFLSERNFSQLLDITYDQKDVNICNMAYTLLFKFMKEQDHIQSLLKLNYLYVIRLFKIALQALLFPNHLWMHLGVLCLLQVNKQRNTSGDNILEQMDGDDIEEIDQQQLKSIEMYLQRLANLKYTTYFSNGLILQALRQLFKETPSCIQKIINESFLRNVFYTIKNKHTEDDNFLFTCLQLLEVVFSDKQMQERYWKKFQPMIKLLEEHGTIKVHDICQRMIASSQ